jgi:alkanesulfonate monooxygenase SsuD/methylene tetrahydromethanopterin reductase-like flavin-dependent oxidoreductase (luciferase family)
VDIGVFIPIGNNGWLISTTSPQYRPTFELNKQVVQRAEHYGLDFALSMIKLRGFGGKSEFWDHNLESFTLMAGLAAVTRRIQLYASVAVLTIPPAIVARMTSTIDSISGGRFGVNIVSGWAKAEYEQMGLWPGEAHYDKRYDYSTEYVTIMRELLAVARQRAALARGIGEERLRGAHAHGSHVDRLEAERPGRSRAQGLGNTAAEAAGPGIEVARREADVCPEHRVAFAVPHRARHDARAVEAQGPRRDLCVARDRS